MTYNPKLNAPISYLHRKYITKDTQYTVRNRVLLFIHIMKSKPSSDKISRDVHLHKYLLGIKLKYFWLDFLNDVMNVDKAASATLSVIC